MSSGEARRVSREDIQLVQNLIEQCIQLHMSRKDAVNLLLSNAKIEPGFTELVWQKLEEENREFFEVYYIRLALKEQIKIFNELLKKQATLMQQIQSTGISPMPVSNGSHMAQFQQNAGCYSIDQTGPSMRPESLQPTMGPALPNAFTNGVSTLQTATAYDFSTPSRRIDFLPNALHAQNSSMRLMQGSNGGVIKSESGYPSDSQIIFDADGNVVETHAPIDDASVATFSGMEPSSQPLTDSLLGMDASSYTQLGQITKNFSFSDLSAYPHVLENYQSSAFVTTDGEHFLDSQEENKPLQTVSESYNSYEDFGSE